MIYLFKKFVHEIFIFFIKENPLIEKRSTRIMRSVHNCICEGILGPSTITKLDVVKVPS